MKNPNSADLLRNLVKTAVKGRGQKRALMRAMGLKSQGTITQWLAGEHNPSVDKLDSIAGFFGVTVADLFQRVQEGASPVTRVPSQSASTHPPEGAADALAQDRLQKQNTTLANENIALRLALDGIADELKTLAAVVKPRKAQGGKPGSRGRR